MIKKIFPALTLFVFCIASTAAFGQSSKGKAKKYVRTADIEMYNNNFQKALELYRRAYAIDTNDAHVAFKLGCCMYSIRKYKQESLPYFEKANKGGLPE